jgi:hypothetical protein
MNDFTSIHHDALPGVSGFIPGALGSCADIVDRGKL